MANQRQRHPFVFIIASFYCFQKLYFVVNDDTWLMKGILWQIFHLFIVFNVVYIQQIWRKKKRKKNLSFVEIEKKGRKNCFWFNLINSTEWTQWFLLIFKRQIKVFKNKCWPINQIDHFTKINCDLIKMIVELTAKSKWLKKYLALKFCWIHFGCTKIHWYLFQMLFFDSFLCSIWKFFIKNRCILKFSNCY